jgi:hypothetical protein
MSAFMGMESETKDNGKVRCGQLTHVGTPAAKCAKIVRTVADPYLVQKAIHVHTFGSMAAKYHLLLLSAPSFSKFET